MSNASRAAARADQHDVGDIYPAFLLGDAALDVALRIGAHVLLYHLDVLHQQLAFVGEDAQHAAEFFIVFAAPGDHLHHVVFANVNSCMHV